MRQAVRVAQGVPSSPLAGGFSFLQFVWLWCFQGCSGTMHPGKLPSVPNQRFSSSHGVMQRPYYAPVVPLSLMEKPQQSVTLLPGAWGLVGRFPFVFYVEEFGILPSEDFIFDVSLSTS